MQMMYCIPKSYRENGLFQLHVMSAQWNRSRNNLAANQLDGYIKGREENGGLGLLPEEILEASFINGQKKPLQEVFPAFFTFSRSIFHKIYFIQKVPRSSGHPDILELFLKFTEIEL